MQIRNFIGGKWINAKGEKTFDSLNPADVRRIVAKAPLDRKSVV
jgi:acyl-CoA reductase-like NAD-dependent aldehyde dehydrogenase